jgi:hypothetical protein
LRDWPTTHQDRYEKLKADLIPRIQERVAEKHLALADGQMEVAWDFLQRLKREKDNVPARDLSTNLRNLVVGSAVNTDKAHMLREGFRPQVNVNVDLSEMLRSMAARGTPLYDRQGNRVTAEEAIAQTRAAIPSTATEIQEDETP